MIIVLGFFRRRRGTTHEEFSDYWANIHGPLIKSIPNIDKYLVRYVQHHLKSNLLSNPQESADYDGFSEAWFVNKEAFRSLQELSFFQLECIADEQRFLDMESTRWVTIDEPVVIIPGPAPLGTRC